MARRTIGALLVAIAALSLALVATPGDADARKRKKKPTFITLDGERLGVFFNDGDSFRTVKPYPKLKTRIIHYNTLESYGPVHRWGDFTAEELYRLAKKGTTVARDGGWTCHRVLDERGKPKRDGYKRYLISCPDLSMRLVSDGLAHVFFFDPKQADPKLLAAQLEAQRAGKGIWKKGVPEQILTSLHSADEKDDPKWKAYHRTADPKTGFTAVIEHDDLVGECEEVCRHGSCMRYIAFNRRFGDDRADCLRWGWKPPAPETPSGGGSAGGSAGGSR